MCEQPPWDSLQSFRLLHNISRLIQSEKNPSFALKNLENLAKRFYEKALEHVYRTSLTADQHFDLEKEYGNLADWCQNACQFETRMNITQIIRLKICLLEIGRYVIVKTSNSLRDGHWYQNAVKLALETATYCHKVKLLSEMAWCLGEAEFYQQLYAQQQNQPQIELKASFIVDGSLLSVLKIVHLFSSTSQMDMSLAVFHLKTLYSVELSSHQSVVLSQVLFNLGLENLNHSEFNNAVFFSKCSYDFGSVGKNASFRNKILRLIALCLFKQNAFLNRDLILHVLDCAENASDTLAVTNLKFQTLVLGKSRSSCLAQTAFKLIKFHLAQDPSKLRKNVLNVFRKLEKSGNSEALTQLLNRIPWCAKSKEEVSTSWMRDVKPHLQWICAEVAVCTCIKQDFPSGSYSWLEEISYWAPSEFVNLESLDRIVKWGKIVAIRLRSRHLALKWFRILVRITLRFGGCPSVVSDAIRFCLATNSDEGYLAAKAMFDEELSQIELNTQLTRLKLLVDVLNGNLTSASATWLRLEDRYKKETDLDSDDWQESLYVLEMGMLAALENTLMNEIAVHFLSAMLLEIKKRSLQTSLLVRVIRFHLKVLFKSAIGNVLVETKCTDNLVSALIFAFIGLKENLSSLDGAHDSGGLELWFGNLAWSLARKLHTSTAFYRHQLFKLSAKLLSLTDEKDKSVNEKIAVSVILSTAAAINSRACSTNTRYKQVLTACLEMINANRDIVTGSDLKKTTLICFYEFHILCELGDFHRLKRALQSYQSNELLKRNPCFFEGLASLSSSGNLNFLRRILPPVEILELPPEDRVDQREPFLQGKLAKIAFECLQKSKHILLHTHPLPVDQIILVLKRTITLSSSCANHSEMNARSHLAFCNEYFSFIAEHREQVNIEEVSLFFNYVWNTSTEHAVFNEERNSDEWVQLVRKIANLTPELGKLHKSVSKDFTAKFSGAWNL